MKKISYFGNEYMVNDNSKWVATCSNGNVLAFTEEPTIFWNDWITVASGVRVGLDLLGATDWKSSLRKVEDILVKEGHPHADLMLKYAMIAQYDDNPWEYFECGVGNGVWGDMVADSAFYSNLEYRLKPQEPKIQVGQIWVSAEGVDVMVDTPSDAETIYFSFDVCGYNYKNCIPIDEFLQNFKRKE